MSQLESPSQEAVPRKQLASKAARNEGKSTPWTGACPSQQPNDNEEVFNFGSFLVPKRKHDGDPSDDEHHIDMRDAKRLHTDTPPTSLSSPSSDPHGTVHKLRKQIEELHNFIESSGLALKAPPSIRKHLESRPGSAAKLAEAIKRDIEKVYDSLMEEMYDDDADDEVTSDDISAAVAAFVSDIERLAKLADPRAVDLAITRLTYLGQHSTGDLDTKHGCGFGDREDEPVDKLMLALVRAKRAAHPDWDSTALLEQLQEEHQALSDYGIETYFTRSIKQLQKWRVPKAMMPEQAPIKPIAPVLEVAPLTMENLARLRGPRADNNPYLATWSAPRADITPYTAPYTQIGASKRQAVVDLTGED